MVRNCWQIEEPQYTKEDMNKFMKKLDGLVAANDPTATARYLNDVAAVANSPSIQHSFSAVERQDVMTQLSI